MTDPFAPIRPFLHIAGTVVILIACVELARVQIMPGDWWQIAILGLALRSA